MKIALVFPGITIDGFAKDDARPKTGWIHHGLCYISSSLKAEGHQVSLIDLRQLSGWGELPGILTRVKPDIAGITMMSVDFDPAVKAAEIIKKTLPGVKIVAGGPHPTIAGPELEKIDPIDYIFQGEAELTFPKLVEDIKNGAAKNKYVRGEAPDLDKIGLPDRGLFTVLEAPIVPFLKMPFVTAIAGRGCVYNCNFCQPAERLIFGRTVRRMHPERFVDELRLTKEKAGLNSLMIHDDCLLEDTGWVERFLKLYSDRKIGKPFVCQARADIIVKHKSLIARMKKRGLAMLLVGFESGSQRMLNFLRKGTTVDQNYKAAAILRRLGVRVWANYMFGIPTETSVDVAETVKFIKAVKPYVASPAFYTPHPGSDLYEYCLKNDLSLIKTHEDFRRNPDSPKIKGIDYGPLRKALEETTALPWQVKLKRKIDRLALGRFNKELIDSYVIPG